MANTEVNCAVFSLCASCSGFSIFRSPPLELACLLRGPALPILPFSCWKSNVLSLYLQGHPELHLRCLQHDALHPSSDVVLPVSLPQSHRLLHCCLGEWQSCHPQTYSLLFFFFLFPPFFCYNFILTFFFKKSKTKND